MYISQFLHNILERGNSWCHHESSHFRGECSLLMLCFLLILGHHMHIPYKLWNKKMVYMLLGMHVISWKCLWLSLLLENTFISASLHPISFYCMIECCLKKVSIYASPLPNDCIHANKKILALTQQNRKCLHPLTCDCTY